MKRNITKTFDGLVKMFISHDNISEEEARIKAQEVIDDPKTGLRYYVALADFSMSDISRGAMVKTPAKYFNNLDHAKIFQLKRILQNCDSENHYSEWEDYSYEQVEDMITELKELSEEYPEYVV